jgi:hypothetical protein
LTFTNLGILPDRRVLKTAAAPYATRNPIINTAEALAEKRMLQGNGGGIQVAKKMHLISFYEFYT